MKPQVTVFCYGGTLADVEAGIEEISRMGYSFIEKISEAPQLELKFANLDERISLGQEVGLVSTVVRYDKAQVKPFRRHTPFGMVDIVSWRRAYSR